MKKQLGFTLVELLAVIVILAIILAIAIPTTAGIINNAKKQAFDGDAKLLIKAANYKKAQDESFDPSSITDLDSLKNNLGIFTDNYQSVQYTTNNGVVLVHVVGKDKWSGLSACGSYKSMKVYVGTCDFDLTAPAVTLNGSNSVNVTIGNSFTDQGANVTDDSGDTLTYNVSGTVDTANLGTYTLTYSVTDNSGNQTTVTRIVNVIRPTLLSIITPYLTTKNGANYYVGATPNNWIEFGQVSSSNTTPIMWRIIRSDSEGIKVIYEGTKNGINAPSQNGIVGNAAWNTSYYLGWENATSARTYLYNWYGNFYAVNKSNYVTTIHWCIGNAGHNLSPTTLSDFLTGECNNSYFDSAKTTDLTAVGLPNPSWYFSSSSSSGCNTVDDSACGTNNFLYDGNTYWTSAKHYPYTDSDYAWTVYSSGIMLHSMANASYSIRPVINLNLSDYYDSGNGSLATPYKLY